ncbi:MAG: hypothetical protein ACRCYU_15930, partial [Nocardioides sp.]
MNNHHDDDTTTSSVDGVVSGEAAGPVVRPVAGQPAGPVTGHGGHVGGPATDSADSVTVAGVAVPVDGVSGRHADRSAESLPVPVDEVVEGEIVSDEESAEIDRRLAGRGGLVVRATQTTQSVVRVSKSVASHERTRTAGKVVLRESWMVVQGLESWAKRAWDASTMGTYRRQIKAAEAVGDRE